MSEDYVASLKEKLKAFQSQEVESANLIKKYKSEISALKQQVKNRGCPVSNSGNSYERNAKDVNPLDLQVKKLTKVIAKTEKALKLILNIDEESISLLRLLSAESLLCLNECYMHGQRNIKKLLNLRKIEHVMDQDNMNAMSEF